MTKVITVFLERNYWMCEQQTLYLVSRQQQREACPEAGAVEHQGRTKVSTQSVLADPWDVMRLRLLLQTTFYHVPPQKALRNIMIKPSWVFDIHTTWGLSLRCSQPALVKTTSSKGTRASDELFIWPQVHDDLPGRRQIRKDPGLFPSWSEWSILFSRSKWWGECMRVQPAFPTYDDPTPYKR